MAQVGTYETWARHFGKSTLDPDLASDLAKAGIAKPPVIPRDLLEASVDVGDLTLAFYDPVLTDSNEALGDGVGILSGITIHLNDTSGQKYVGKLPYSVEATDSRESLRRRIGAPPTADEDEHWDEWIFDGLEVTAMYSDDFRVLKTLLVFIPDSE